jgi:predicted anti-sigma-YlaC factor YlaD
MHGLIRERLEDYLKGAPGSVPEVEDHLRVCESCREEAAWMQEQARLLHVLAPVGPVDPPVGFYARVLERIESESRPSFWDAFLEPSFGRRLLATSLMLVCLLGGYVAFMEVANHTPASTPEAVMVAEHPPGLGSNVDRDRETVLVSLATYRDYR